MKPLFTFLVPVFLLILLPSCEDEIAIREKPGGQYDTDLGTLLSRIIPLQEKIQTMRDQSDSASTVYANLFSEPVNILDSISQYLDLEGDTLVITTEPIQINPEATEDEMVVYSWPDERGTINYQISANADRYFHDVFIAGNQVLSASETKAEPRSGTLTAGDITIEWAEERYGRFSIGVIDAAQAKDMRLNIGFDTSGEMDYWVGDQLRYEMSWNESGSAGTYTSYAADGETVLSSGVWPTPPPPEDFTVVRLAFVGPIADSIWAMQGNWWAATRDDAEKGEGTRFGLWNQSLSFTANRINRINTLMNPPATATTTNEPITGANYSLVYQWSMDDGTEVAYQISSTKFDYVHQAFTRPAGGGAWQPEFYAEQSREDGSGKIYNILETGKIEEPDYWYDYALDGTTMNLELYGNLDTNFPWYLPLSIDVNSFAGNYTHYFGNNGDGSFDSIAKWYDGSWGVTLASGTWAYYFAPQPSGTWGE